MYTACLHCHTSLGSNAEIEALPIGRALAFDEARGRLWVICRACRRWNLTPLDARFEAIEACERLWRETPTRYASGEIGLAVRPSKLRLIRVGQPEREEFAFWRYGEQLVGRQRSANVVGAVGLAAFTWSLAASPAIASYPLLYSIGGFSVSAFHYWLLSRLWATRTRIANPQDPADLLKVRVLNAGAWTIRRMTTDTLEVVRPLRPGIEARPAVHFREEAAHQALTKLMPVINIQGANASQVRQASQLIASQDTPDRFIEQLIPHDQPARELGRIPHIERLALELAHAETRERHFLEGALDRLTLEWQEAERIAAIADNLLIPASVESAFQRLRGKQVRPTTPE